jgi:hypothetical protein
VATSLHLLPARPVLDLKIVGILFDVNKTDQIEVRRSITCTGRRLLNARKLTWCWWMVLLVRRKFEVANRSESGRAQLRGVK